MNTVSRELSRAPPNHVAWLTKTTSSAPVANEPRACAAICCGLKSASKRGRAPAWNTTTAFEGGSKSMISFTMLITILNVAFKAFKLMEETP